MMVILSLFNMRKVGGDEGPGCGLLHLRSPRPHHVDHEASHEAGGEAGHVTRVQHSSGTRVGVGQLANLEIILHLTENCDMY